MTLSPRTSTSTITHWSPWKVFERESVQCGVCSLPFITTCVPGVHRLAVDRSARPSPPSNCTSIETGKSCALRIVSGAWQWSIRPLLRKAQPGPPGVCSPTKRYSARSR